MFKKFITDFQRETRNQYKKGANIFKIKLAQSLEFLELVKCTNDVQNSSSVIHPKMGKVLELLLEFFHSPSTRKSSKAIVFTENRKSCFAIKEMLN